MTRLGIDLNANWGYKWRAPQHNNPCAETYSGKAAFEAYETRAMADYLLASNGRSPLYDRHDSIVPSGTAPRRKSTRAFIDLHSYGQLCESRITTSQHCLDARVTLTLCSHVPLRPFLRRLSLRRGKPHGSESWCGESDEAAGRRGVHDGTGV